MQFNSWAAVDEVRHVGQMRQFGQVRQLAQDEIGSRREIIYDSGNGEGRILHVVLLLGEDAQQEFAFLVGLERRRYDGVHAGWQFEAAAHLAQVDEWRRARHRRRVLEKAPVQRRRHAIRSRQLKSKSSHHLIIHLQISRCRKKYKNKSKIKSKSLRHFIINFNIEILSSKTWEILNFLDLFLDMSISMNNVESYVIDGVSNSEAVETKFALGTSILLHQRHNNGALVVVIIVCNENESIRFFNLKKKKRIISCDILKTNYFDCLTV